VETPRIIRAWDLRVGKGLQKKKNEDGRRGH